MKAVKFFKLVMFGVVVFGLNIGTANAVLITGSIGIIGGYEADSTTLTLIDTTGVSGADDLSTVTFGTSGSIFNGEIVYDPFAAVVNVLQIGGWQLDLTTLVIDPNSTTEKLKLSGTGVLSGFDFDATVATWSFSAQSASSYSMTIASQVMSVAEPGVLGLLALGFIGVGVGQRIRDRSKPGL